MTTTSFRPVSPRSRFRPAPARAFGRTATTRVHQCAVYACIALMLARFGAMLGGAQFGIQAAADKPMFLFMAFHNVYGNLDIFITGFCLGNATLTLLRTISHAVLSSVPPPHAPCDMFYVLPMLIGC